jgi:tRNA G18 (ribose-2'-O)-methylase SpoU
MNLIPINDLADPRLAPYANLRDAELAQRADPLDAAAHGGLFIAEGDLVVRRLLASRFALHSVLTTPTRLASLTSELEAKTGDAPIFLAEPPLLNQIVGFNMHRGLLAIGRRGPGLSLPDLIRHQPLLVLEDLTNHDNIGGIFRNAAALGGPGIGILLSPRCADPLYRKSLRVSMGCALAVPFARADQWPDALSTLTAHGFESWALTPSDSAEPLHSLRPSSKPIALILGTEGAGLTDAAIQSCSHRVRIEMSKVDPSVDSLNVAMAAGIALSCLASHRTKSK